MAFDEKLAERVRSVVAGKGLAEKKMFGGLAFLARGNMSVGIYGEELIVRLDPAEAEQALKQPGVRVFDITGRPMKGWVLVGGTALADTKALARWVERGMSYAMSL